MPHKPHCPEPSAKNDQETGTDGKFPFILKTQIIMSKMSLFKQYEETFRLSLGSLSLGSLGSPLGSPGFP